MSLGVSKDEAEQEKSKNRALQRGQRKPEMPIAGEKQNAVYEFDDEITGRDTGFAVAAAAAQDKPTEYRNIVVKGNRFFTMRTRRAGPHDGEAAGQAGNGDIQETAEEQP